MKVLLGVLAVFYLLLLLVSLRGWGHVGNTGGDGYRHDGIKYIHVGKGIAEGRSVREGSVGGAGGRSGRGGK